MYILFGCMDCAPLGFTPLLVLCKKAVKMYTNILMLRYVRKVRLMLLVETIITVNV